MFPLRQLAYPLLIAGMNAATACALFLLEVLPIAVLLAAVAVLILVATARPGGIATDTNRSPSQST